MLKPNKGDKSHIGEQNLTLIVQFLFFDKCLVRQRFVLIIYQTVFIVFHGKSLRLQVRFFENHKAIMMK